MHALLIDDSRVMRTIIGNILKAAGFTVAEAGNGREGLDRLRERPATELVLVDWNMPQMNGLEFVRAARANPAWAQVRILMVTTETDMAQLSQALEAGADEYVMKPFNREVFLDKLGLVGIRPTGGLEDRT
jgi:two-component system chemotaxis response regulator CheY